MPMSSWRGLYELLVPVARLQAATLTSQMPLNISNILYEYMLNPRPRDKI